MAEKKKLLRRAKPTDGVKRKAVLALRAQEPPHAQEPVPEAKLRRARIGFALDRIVEGDPDRDAARAVRERFGVATLQARRDVDAAWREIRQSHEARTPEMFLARGALQRDRLVRKAILDGEARVALSAMDSRDKLLGLYDESTFASDAAARNLLEVMQDALRDD